MKRGQKHKLVRSEVGRLNAGHFQASMLLPGVAGVEGVLLVCYCGWAVKWAGPGPCPLSVPIKVTIYGGEANVLGESILPFYYFTFLLRRDGQILQRLPAVMSIRGRCWAGRMVLYVGFILYTDANYRLQYSKTWT